MNSDKRIINVVGSMGGLKTTKSSLSWEVLKKDKEEKEHYFRGSKQSSLTNHCQQLQQQQQQQKQQVYFKLNIAYKACARN